MPSPRRSETGRWLFSINIKGRRAGRLRPTYEKENIKIIFVLYYFYGFSIFDKCVQIMLKL